MYKSRPSILLMLLAVAVGFGQGVQAAPVTIFDPNSDFSVTYDTEQTGLFGAPILSNNHVFFIPSQFFAESVNGDGQVITNSTIQLILTATTPGFSLDRLVLSERGDYLIDGPGATVSVHGQMQIYDTSSPFNFFSDFLSSSSDFTINDGELHNWIAGAFIGPGSGWTGAEQIVLTLENLLIASTDTFNTAAFIEKKFEGVQISVNPVPVPAAAWLFGSALLGLIATRPERPRGRSGRTQS